MKTVLGTVAASWAVIAGCAAPDSRGAPDWVASQQPNPIRTATAHRQTALSCSTLEASNLSARDAPPEYRSARFVTPDLAVFQIGMEGCGKRASYLIVCERDIAKDCVVSTPRP